MGWNVLIDMMLEHDYYAPNMPPVTVWPTERDAFAKAGLLLRQSGARVFVLAEDGNFDLPGEVSFDLEPQNSEVISVTEGGDWTTIPYLHLPSGKDSVQLVSDVEAQEAQRIGHPILVRVSVVLNHSARRNVTLQMRAMSSFWAYHVIGPGNDDVMIEDAEGEIQFDELGTRDLPDGTSARVIRSRAALPARARPSQRFSLSRPGPFGPRTLIPVLPAPQPLFAKVPGPEGAGAIIQSDIYVSIF